MVLHAPLAQAQIESMVGSSDATFAAFEPQETPHELRANASAQSPDDAISPAEMVAEPGGLRPALLTNTQYAEKVLPLPGWLTKVYFIFPVILYIPDALFNYYVYSDGISNKSTNLIIQVGFVVLWSFLSVGVVGMAYLLSVLAPWHWGQGHRIQAIFCGFGVLVATGITTWNSLAYRSQNFVQFQTDQWAYALWPQLHANHISVTMILVSIAPPFWGLFWAIVQPTQTGRSLRQLQESHEERLMRLQQEAELKRLRAQTNATIREAQVRGMAQTAAAVREQAGGVLNRQRDHIVAAATPLTVPATPVLAVMETSSATTAAPVVDHAASAHDGTLHPDIRPTVMQPLEQVSMRAAGAAASVPLPPSNAERRGKHQGIIRDDATAQQHAEPRANQQGILRRPPAKGLFD